MTRRVLHAIAAVALAAAGSAFAQGDASVKEQPKSDPYSLASCPVSGKKLTAEAVVKVVDGREVRFCCDGCPSRFEADPAKYLEKVDKELVKQQLPYYPMQTCLISGESLVEDGKDIAINHIYRNRLVRFCCKGCVGDFEKDPAPALAKLDQQIIEKQRAEYPLDTCLIAGDKLGSMGEPVELVIGSRLVRLCCKGCRRELSKNVSLHLAKLDDAWRKKHGHDGGKGDHAPGHDKGGKGG